MPEVVNCQRNQEWHDARHMRITASLAAACLSVYWPRITDPYHSAKKAWRIIVEGEKEDENAHMAWGRQFEPTARLAFEAECGYLVEETGFWTHPAADWLGASPDGLIGDDGLLECKCPEVAEPPGGIIPLHHLIQMQVQLACTERSVCFYYRYGKDETSWMRPVHRAGTIGLILKLRRFYEEFVLANVEPGRKKPVRRKKVQP